MHNFHAVNFGCFIFHLLTPLYAIDEEYIFGLYHGTNQISDINTRPHQALGAQK